MKRKIYLYWGNDEEYEVASDATITSEYSETLDSASVVVPNVASSKGIVYGAKPYDEVYLSVVLADGTEECGAWMLIDSVDSAQTSFSGTAYFDVTLQLMSETKYLEKKQLPNVSVTHSLTTGQKTLYEAISYYLGAYPIEFTGSGGRTSLLSIDDSADWNRFKNAKCSDVMMSKPTLRQCLTTLMSQVGCIPVVKHRKLSYLDLGAATTAFKIGGKAPGGSVRRSVSSDSWVNTLVAESSQCVDKDSSCIMESICFRDRDNVLLKQTENLKLETRYPIYEVKKLVMNAYVSGTANFNSVFIKGGNGVFSGIGGRGTNGTTGDMPGCICADFVTRSGKIALRFGPWNQATTDAITANGVVVANVTLAKANSDGSLTALKTKTVTASISWSNAKQSDSSTWSYVYADVWDEGDYTGEELSIAFLSWDTDLFNIYVNGHLWTSSDENPPYGIVTDSFAATDDEHNQYDSYFKASEFVFGTWEGKRNPYVFYRKDTADKGFYASQDITKLCVESSKRAQLNVDFMQMPAWSTIDEMSKWAYATVGYSIGGNSIEGFSSTYSESKGFWNKSKTYIENIVDSTGMSRQGVNRYYASAIPQKALMYVFDNQLIANPFFDDKHNNFSVMFFDIEYIPMIQAKVAYDKDDVILPLEQLDSAESGVSDMDSVTRLEEQKADRLGNPVWSVHARVGSYADLPALNSKWDGKIAFKRTLKFGANAIDAEYALSEDYVIKNYFTSIMTKYRAYEYVDYSQSIERREVLRAYIRLSSSGSGNSGNKFSAAAFPTALATARTFIDALEGYQDDSSRLTGAGYRRKDLGCATECELSAMATGNRCALTMKEYDNASDGPYVDGTYLTISGTYKADPIGGIPQKWYDSLGGDVPYLIFHTQEKTIRPEAWASDASAYVQEHVRAMQKYPRYYFAQGAVSDEDYDVFWMVKFPFSEKDASELLSFSVQFEACWCSGNGGRFNDKDAARFSKWLFHFSSAMGGYPSASAKLAYRAAALGDSWSEAKRAKSDSEAWVETDSFLTYQSDIISTGYSLYALPSKVPLVNTKKAIEVAVLDGDDVYPLMWLAVNAVKSAYVYMTCVPGKSDKELKESGKHSILYESR